ncbi:hypothetical protein [Polaromonas sp. YR568]|uniref:hypothetical protein n=1 Tax=Polaromonas sp. YR568 TaxID=1855301 RepID=UPI003137DCD8
MRSSITVFVAALAGAGTLALVPVDWRGDFILWAFVVCIVASWVVVAQSGAMRKGPTVLVGAFDPIGMTKKSRARTMFFYAAAFVAGACACLLFIVAGSGNAS